MKYDANDIFNSMSDIEKALHSAKLRYDRMTSTLNKLIHTDRLLENKDTINVYIDIFSVLNGLYKEELEDQIANIDIYNRYMLVSELINIAGHYRHYFFRKLGKYTNIIMYYSDKESDYCTGIIHDYKNTYYNKYIRFGNESRPANKILMNTILLVKDFMEYIPHAYVINTGNVEPRGYIRSLVDDTQPYEYNLIITNDPLYYDMLHYKTNISVLHLKGVNSINIYMGNVYDYLTRDLIKEIEYPSNYLLPLVMSYKSNPHIGLSYKNRYGIYRSIVEVNKLITNGVIANDIEYNADVLETLLKDDTLVNNYRLVSSKNLAQHISQSDQDFIDNQFIDRNDFEGVKAVCNEHFKKNEVILPFLFDGETIV